MPTGTQYLAIGLGAGAVYYGLRTIWRPNLLTVMDDDDSSSDDSGKNTDKELTSGLSGAIRASAVVKDLVVPQPIPTQSATEGVKRALTGGAVLGAKEAAANGGEKAEQMYRERPGAKRGKRRTEKQIMEEQKKAEEAAKKKEKGAKEKSASPVEANKSGVTSASTKSEAPSTAMAIAYSTAAKAADAVLDAFDFLSGTKDKDKGHAKPAKKVEAKKSPLDIAVAVVAEEGETYKSSGRLACAKRSISRSIYYSSISDEAGNIRDPKKPWVDPDMAQTDSSLFAVSEHSKLTSFLTDKEDLKLTSSDIIIGWKRPIDFCTARKPPGKLLPSFEPTWLWADGVAASGSSDDSCDFWDTYFTTAVVAAGQFSPHICDDTVDPEFEAQGIYGVALHWEGAWTMVYVDSSMPCFKRRAASSAAQWHLLFGTAYDHREVWASVIVKAFAKQCSSYEAMHKKGVTSLLQALFGGESKAVNLSMIRGGDKTQLSESVWASIRNKGPLLVLAGSRSVSTRGQDDDDMHGIRKGRSFRVVSCIETSKIKLIQLADPMIGKMQSKWDGPFSAGSTEWTPSLREAAAKVTIDGGFWMPFSDFLVLFDNMWTCTVPRTNQQMRMNESILAFAAEKEKRACLKPGIFGLVKQESDMARADGLAKELIEDEERKHAVTFKGKGGKKKKR